MVSHYSGIPISRFLDFSKRRYKPKVVSLGFVLPVIYWWYIEVCAHVRGLRCSVLLIRQTIKDLKFNFYKATEEDSAFFR